VSVFGDPEFVKTLKEEFICVAIDQHRHRRRKDLEFTLFEKLIHQTGDRGFIGTFYGIVNAKNEQLIRFDPVASGEYWGESRSARNAPKGKFPFAVALHLLDGAEIHDMAPPGPT
jgi:hypothetical protein